MSVYVRLRVAAEAYAVPVGNVREISPLGELTPVPGAPPEVLGVRNLRGQILPVADLALVLGLPGASSPALLLVAEAGGRQAGLAVDEVISVGELAGPDGSMGPGLLAGSALTGGDLVGFIDMTRSSVCWPGRDDGRHRRRAGRDLRDETVGRLDQMDAALAGGGVRRVRGRGRGRAVPPRAHHQGRGRAGGLRRYPHPRARR